MSLQAIHVCEITVQISNVFDVRPPIIASGVNRI